MFKKKILAAFIILSIGSGNAIYADNCSNSKKAKYDKDTHHTAYKQDIIDTAIANGSFSTLATALQAAGLVSTLKGDGPFTVFAPTDEAFAKLPAGTVESLLLPENKDKLVSILTYHVVPGKVKAKDVVKLDTAKTVQGSSVAVTVQGSSVMIDNANVLLTDVKASNGIIHVLDSVILPN